MIMAEIVVFDEWQDCYLVHINADNEFLIPEIRSLSENLFPKKPLSVAILLEPE